jgi:hypothetical protein
MRGARRHAGIQGRSHADFSRVLGRGPSGQSQGGNLTELVQEVAADELRSRGHVVPLSTTNQPKGVGRSAADEFGAANELGAVEASDAAAAESAIILATERFRTLAAVLDEGDLELVTVHRLTNPLTANVLRACLESHGIYVHLWGEHLGTAHIVFSGLLARYMTFEHMCSAEFPREGQCSQKINNGHARVTVWATGLLQR